MFELGPKEMATVVFPGGESVLSQLAIFQVLRATFGGSVDVHNFSLPTDETKHISLRSRGQSIRVISGNVWISCGGNDILLEPGEQMQLPRFGRKALISTVGSAPSIIEILCP